MTAAVTSGYGYFRPAPRIHGLVAVSLILHAALLFAFHWASSRTRTRINFGDRVMVTHLLRKGEPRDPKLLPRKPKAPPPPAEKAVAVSTDARSPSESAKKVLAKEKSAEHDKKTLANLEDKLRKMLETGKEESREGRPEGVEDGDVANPDEASEGDIYFTQVYRRMRENYVLPSIISEKERMYLKADLVIYIDQTGKIVKTDFEKRSGNQHFDSAIETAIQRSSPLPPPPESLRKLFRDEGLLVTFRP